MFFKENGVFREIKESLHIQAMNKLIFCEIYFGVRFKERYNSFVLIYKL